MATLRLSDIYKSPPVRTAEYYETLIAEELQVVKL